MILVKALNRIHHKPIQWSIVVDSINSLASSKHGSIHKPCKHNVPVRAGSVPRTALRALACQARFAA